MPSTRSQDALPFAASKSTSSKSSSKSKVKKAPPTSLELTTALFRSECLALFSAPPPVPSHIKLKPTDKIDVLAVVERLSASGIQQSVQMCQVLPGGSRAGGEGESWITKMEGAKVYFPRASRVTKRLRAVAESDEESGGEADRMLDDGSEEEQEEQATPNSRKKSRTSTSSSTRSKKDAPEAPRKSRRTAPASSPSSSSRRRRHAAADSDDEEFDDGANTETEASHLARKHAPYGASNLASSSAGSSSSSRRRSHHHSSATSSHSHSYSHSLAPTPSTSGLRRSARHQPEVEQQEVVKREDEDDNASISGGYAASLDDLSSLCGRVEGFKVEETVEPGSFPFFPFLILLSPIFASPASSLTLALPTRHRSLILTSSLSHLTESDFDFASLGSSSAASASSFAPSASAASTASSDAPCYVTDRKGKGRASA
jgi:hypothetical protein